jgi:hypothetical protein
VIKIVTENGTVRCGTVVWIKSDYLLYQIRNSLAKSYKNNSIPLDFVAGSTLALFVHFTTKLLNDHPNKIKKKTLENSNGKFAKTV